MSEGASTLKCVIAWSNRRNLCSLVSNALEDRIGWESLRRLGDEAVLVDDPASPGDIRDWVSPVLHPDESLLVLEFEKWSGRGPGIDTEWLMRRGH
jgi:hypothetical protein